MKWPKKGKGIKGIRPTFIIIDEVNEYGNLDRLDGLEESMERHPSRARGTWHDSHHYEEKYGRKP
jgi:hypothetical protein